MCPKSYDLCFLVLSSFTVFFSFLPKYKEDRLYLLESKSAKVINIKLLGDNEGWAR